MKQYEDILSEIIAISKQKLNCKNRYLWNERRSKAGIIIRENAAHRAA